MPVQGCQKSFPSQGSPWLPDDISIALNTHVEPKRSVHENVFLLPVGLGYFALFSTGIIRPIYTTPCVYHTT